MGPAQVWADPSIFRRNTTFDRGRSSVKAFQKLIGSFTLKRDPERTAADRIDLAFIDPPRTPFSDSDSLRHHNASAKSAGNAGIRLVTWDEVSNRFCVRLLLIAVATAVCMVGIRVGPNDWRGSDAGGRNSVELSWPATDAVAAVRVTRIKVGGGNFVPDTLSVERLWFGVAKASPRSISLDPPNAFRNALRTLPLASRAPPLA
jgi:hypothetical protein